MLGKGGEFWVYCLYVRRYKSLLFFGLQELFESW